MRLHSLSLHTQAISVENRSPVSGQPWDTGSPRGHGAPGRGTATRHEVSGQGVAQWQGRWLALWLWFNPGPTRIGVLAPVSALPPRLCAPQPLWASLSSVKILMTKPGKVGARL